MKDVKFIDGNREINLTSRYNNIRYYIDNNNNTIQETFDFTKIKRQNNDIYFEIPLEYAHRPDLISLKMYNTMMLYWVIAMANDIADPFADFYVSRRIRIPDRNYIFTEILIRSNKK